MTVQQREHYDRRTQVDRENKGRRYTEGLLERALTPAPTSTEGMAGPSTRGPTTHIGMAGPSTREPMTHIGSDSDSDSEGPGLGDIVAIVLPGSTVTKPTIELGKVLRINTAKTKMQYLLLSPVGENKYHCEVGQVRKASADRWVYPVDVDYIPQDNAYKLLSMPTEIHLSKYPHT